MQCSSGCSKITKLTIRPGFGVQIDSTIISTVLLTSDKGQDQAAGTTQPHALE